MTLSSDILTQFAKVTNNTEKKEATESTVYGTVVTSEGQTFVKIDGSDRLTPVSSTTTTADGDRVTVMIKNHSAVVTGNTSSPSATAKSVEETNTKIEEVHTLIADKANISDLEAEKARIDNLVAEEATIKGSISASEAKISNLEAADATITGRLTSTESSIENLYSTKIDASIVKAEYATIANLEATNSTIHNLESDYGDFKELTTSNFTAANADISSLKTDKLSVSDATATYATIENLKAANANISDLQATRATITDLNAAKADISDLKTNKLNTSDAAIKYAEIDFANIDMAAVQKLFTKSGMIENLDISTGHVTGELVGVTIKGDLIEGGTVKADKLVVKGSDGLYYKLNTDGCSIEAEQTSENSLNGSVITAKSITATKVSVDDLVAFGATIGGFHITDSAIYSGVKATVDSPSQGIYEDSTGQLALGDDTNYLRYYKASDGKWKLEIRADSFVLQTGKSIADELAAATSTATAAQSTANTASSTANTALTAANSSVATVTTQYYDSTSATKMTGGSWSDTSPTWQEGHYIWSRAKTVSADGKTTEYSEAVCITGNTGKQGGTGSAMHWNLLSNTNTSSLVANISTSAGETSREFVDDETDANVKVLKLTSNLSSFTWWYLYVRQPSNIKKLIESGPDTLTVSMDIRINTDLPNTIFPFSIRDGNGANVAYDGPAMAYAFVKDTWKHCVWHMTKVAGQSYSAQALYSKLPKEFAQNGAIFELKNLKLEEGNTATEWCTTQAETIGADGTTYYTWIKYADSPTSGMSDNPSGKTYIGIAYNKTTATESTSYSDYSWSLIKGDKGDKGNTGATGAAGVDYSQGKMLYTDPTFDAGINSCKLYNVTGNGNVTITRSAKSSDNPFDKTTYELVIANKGTASPACGGFFWANRSRANARFIYRIIAKIPTGYTLTWNADAYGSGSSITSRTSMAGTGKFQEYVFEAKCGATGTFSTIGFFYLEGTVGTADNPVTWYVAYATCFDMTSSSDVQTAQSTADQAASNAAKNAESLGTLQSGLQTTSDGLQSVVKSLGDTSTLGESETLISKVSAIKQTADSVSINFGKYQTDNDKAVADLGKSIDDKTAYIDCRQDDDGTPHVILGESSTSMQLDITNKEIDFLENGHPVAYISGQKLYITNAMITNEFRIGTDSASALWKRRSSGNFGLRT